MKMIRRSHISDSNWMAIFTIAGLFFGESVQGNEPASTELSPSRPLVEFNRDIRPILSDLCFQCHGPDSQHRKADLRLDTEAGATTDFGGRRAIVPRDPKASELFSRITSTDAAEKMPPPDSGKKISAQQIEKLRQWIEQGAQWQGHWSFLPPRRSTLPEVQHRHRVRNVVDVFVLSRLEAERLSFSPDADKTSLIRRVSFDLTGLPPTPSEVDAFLADDSNDAYDKVVNRLLDSPRFGERMAVRWLDGARYADTNGYQSDGERTMWRWRDWVIDAYNRNLPFDRFTIEQLAGDMLSEATLDQRIASGFNRNHRGNAEGGIIPEEYAVEYVVDRVETTNTVWLGLTMGCARCHNHKFDGFTQTEFYQLFSFFNNVPEFGRAIKFGNSPPLIKTPTREQQAALKLVEEKAAAAERELAQRQPEIKAGQTEWERAPFDKELDLWTISRGQIAHFPLESAAEHGLGDAAAIVWENGGAAFAPGKLGKAAEFDGRRYIVAGNVAPFGYNDKFSLSIWIKPDAQRGGTVISRMTDADHADGYYVVIENGKVQLNLIKRWLDDALRVETEAALVPEQWQHLLVTYDGSRLASGVNFYIDGKLQKQRVILDLLNQTFANKEPLRIGGGNGPDGRFHGSLDDVRIYDRVLTDAEARVLATAESIAKIRSLSAENRSKNEAGKLEACYLQLAAPASIREAVQRVEALRDERTQLIENFPTTMVMQEMPVPRETFVLIRGEYDKRGERVHPGVPASLQTSADHPPQNRLELARWIVDQSNPLTARVAVNRVWQMLFGTGIVKTVDDFGSQGEWPTHPELLDWLAVEFMSTETSPTASHPQPASKTAWDVKALLKLLVTSTTYRQSSKVSPELLQKDPDNRLLARGPRVRLSAEMVRDQALWASGLLVEKQGGPSVKPYQPAGLWKELADVDYVQDSGENLYRRTMYTYFKRTVAPPTMMTFDAAGRETCVVRETRTNTPLQALTLMNEITFLEAARGLAQRVMRDGGEARNERLTLAFRLATSRTPRQQELEILASGWEAQRARFAQDRQAADRLTIIGELARPDDLDVVDLAAYSTVAGLLLNLDETITKE